MNYTMNYTIYPTGENTGHSGWNATGDYYSKNIEHFADIDYQDFLYSIVVYFYIKGKNGRKTIKAIKSVEMIDIKKEKIQDLNYSNSTSDDIKSEFSMTVVDLTSYIPRQPMLKLKYFINDGEIVNKIDYTYPNPVDPVMREYTVDLNPFKSINFIFDLQNMKIQS